jgi:hypothetical protein
MNNVEIIDAIKPKAYGGNVGSPINTNVSIDYDIEFVVPMTIGRPDGLVGLEGSVGGIGTDETKRLDFFKKYGLLNVQDKKVLLTILIGTESIDDFKFGFKKDIDVRIIRDVRDEVCWKVYNFYTSKKYFKGCKWYCRVDDDSINDVSGLVDHLENTHGENKFCYACPSISDHLQRWDKILLYNMGINLPHAVEGQRPYKRSHEVEACFLSNKSMTTILSTKLSYEYLSRRKFYPGWFDVSLALANNMIDNPVPYHDKRMKLHPEGRLTICQCRSCQDVSNSGKLQPEDRLSNSGKLHSFMTEYEERALHVHGVPYYHEHLYEIHRTDNTINKQFL